MPYWAGVRNLVVAGLTASVVLSFAGFSRGYAEEATAAATPATLIQFRSFMAPVGQPGIAARPCLRAVTLLVEVDKSEARGVCSFLPRIRDAVLVELFHRPIPPGDDVGMDVESAAARLVTPLNQVLGKDLVRRVYLIPGSELVAERAASRLPLDRVVGCQQQRGRGEV